MVEITAFDEFNDPGKPRRVMKYVLIGCSEGSVTVVSDENEFQIKSHQVFTVTSGQIHYFKKIKGAKGFILEFTLDFFSKNDKDIELIFHNGLFCHFTINEVIPVPKYSAIEAQFKLIRKELVQRPYQYLISIHSRIELILVEINRAKIQRGDEIYKPDALFLRFLELVRANFENNYSVRHFAGLLSTTETRLNEQAKQHAGKTAQNVIYGLIVSEAKRLLTYHNLSVKEVAHQLGFNDPFYFSNFFKKHTGLSPKTYQSRFAL
ncbi:helix-turn-helix domain-containing protein [bacterium]|nr:helix-turn-helix domain-containing protein [bacterium]